MSDYETYQCKCGRNHPVGVVCAIGQRQSELAPATCSVAALRAEIDDIIKLAEWGIAADSESGDVIMEAYWDGHLSAAKEVKQWLKNQPQNARTQPPPG
jgi:hypothetical protein